jgi:hypothetical protein
MLNCMLRFFILLFFHFFGTCSSHAQSIEAHTKGKTLLELATYLSTKQSEFLAIHDTTGFLKFLDEAETVFTKNNYKEALYIVKTAKIHYERPEKITSLERVEKVKALKDAAQALNNPFLNYKMNILLGWSYRSAGQIVAAFDTYHIAYEQIKAYNNSNKEELYFLFTVAFDYYGIKNYKRAIEYASESFKNSTSANIKLYAADLIGMSYILSNQTDSARLWFKEGEKQIALNGAHENKKGWQGIIAGNIGYTYFLDKNYNPAIPLLQNGIELASKDQLFDNSSLFCSLLAKTYLELGNTTAIPALLEQAKKHRFLMKTPLNTKMFFEASIAYYKKTNAYNLLSIYQDSLLQIYQAEADEMALSEVYNNELNALKTKRAQDIVDLEHKVTVQKWIRYSIFIAIILGLLIALLIYNRNLLRHKVKLSQQEIQHQKTEAHLNQTKTNLKNFALQLAEKNNLIEQLQAEENSKPSLEQLQYIQELRTASILTDKDWMDFKNKFELAYPNFFDSLRKNYPQITPAETRFLTLTKLQLSNKEMSGLLGVGTEAIRSTRSRLKKKLELEDDAFDNLIERL